ncbi:MAG: VOC family protein [Gemmatimonadetes bacterium]|nr:VOC family protein [Gemmatimonadota bacterium]
MLAASLDQGVAWCEATLGVTPGPGGEHPLMGTHNRLLRIATVNHPCAYLEIIAINPAAPGPQPARPARWFDMDDEALRAAVAAGGPRLIHFVAQVPDVRRAVAALAEQGIERGEVIQTSRMTPRGPLQWQITVRPDGQRLFDGCLPTLIEWGPAHPATTMPDSGVSLHSLAISHPRVADLQVACKALDLAAVTVQPGPANLCATVLTPRGAIKLESKGL